MLYIFIEQPAQMGDGRDSFLIHCFPELELTGLSSTTFTRDCGFH